MKKYFFYLILSLLLNQYLSQSDPDPITGCVDDESNTGTECVNRKPSDETIYKCGLVGEQCQIVKKDCTEISDATEENCDKVSESGKICYLSGTSACNLATSCEDNINYHTSTTEAFCSRFNSADNNCVNEGNTCVLKHLCKDTKKTSYHDCSFGILEDSTKRCVLKIGSSTECEEVTEEEAAEREKGSGDDSSELCTGKTQEECKLIFSDSIFIQCKWETDKCVLDKKYETCASASNLREATNEQCMNIRSRDKKTCVKGVNGCLDVNNCEDIKEVNIEEESCKSTEFQSYQNCIKGTSGCKLINITCTDTTITNFESDCEYLSAPNGYKCYYDGEKCAQANSCASVPEMKLTDNEKMKNICSKFNEEPKVCVPEGNKCVLKNKEDVEEDVEEDTKDTKSDSSSTKVESSSNNGSDEKEGSDSKNSDETNKIDDEGTDKTTDENGYSDDDDDKESSSSELLSFSFGILFFILF